MTSGLTVTMSVVQKSDSPRTAHGPQEPTIDEELRCRYSNKKCMNPRTHKRTGGLHTFCEEHRDNANRNQRKLDQRKRTQRRQQQSIQTFYETIQATQHQFTPPPFISAQTVPTEVNIEPLARPTALLEEDVDVLVTLFGHPIMENKESSSGSDGGAFRL